MDESDVEGSLEDGLDDGGPSCMRYERAVAGLSDPRTLRPRSGRGTRRCGARVGSNAKRPEEQAPGHPSPVLQAIVESTS